MKLKNLKLIIFVLIIFVSSCTPYKDVPYFQDLKKTKTLKEKINNFSPLTIQPGDLLGIHVTSLNHEADAPFNYNLGAITPNTPSGIDRQEQDEVVGNLVDSAGNIHLYMVGTVKVKGYSTSEIASILESKLSEYLKNPNVNVRIENFKISVLGDVLHPGVFGSKDERITVTEAIALAGDLNITGIRDSVLLIREVDGNRLYIPLNLGSKKIFNSPYFYLKNNDIIYVQPNKNKVEQSDTGLVKVSLIISALSVVALLLTRL